MSPLWSLGEAWSCGSEESLISYLLSSGDSLVPMVVETALTDKGTGPMSDSPAFWQRGGCRLALAGRVMIQPDSWDTTLRM